MSIVDRLRGLHDYAPGLDFQQAMTDAADEIERLQKELAAAVEWVRTGGHKEYRGCGAMGKCFCGRDAILRATDSEDKNHE